MVFTAFSTVFQSSLRQLKLLTSFLGFTSASLGQGHSHEKKPEDPGRFEPRSPELRVKHYTTEPRGPPPPPHSLFPNSAYCLETVENMGGGGKVLAVEIFPFSNNVLNSVCLRVVKFCRIGLTLDHTIPTFNELEEEAF